MQWMIYPKWQQKKEDLVKRGQNTRIEHNITVKYVSNDQLSTTNNWEHRRVIIYLWTLLIPLNISLLKGVPVAQIWKHM